jgi:diapolycopene oxygenase
MPTIQFRYDLWYVEGGLYNIARGLARLLDELGVTVHLHSEVTKIRTDGDRATGIVLGDGRFVPAEIVVCNMEVLPAHRKLLDVDGTLLRKLRRFEPACSGLVLDLGLDREYPQLAHHNFFFSADQKKHFQTVFRRRELPEDPTIYLVAASRTDPTVAPQGCDCLKILPHIPYLDEERPLGRDDYLRFKEVVLDKLERMGLTDLREHVVFEHVWTPLDIRDRYYSNLGSIYGVVSDRWRNQGFKAPKRSARFENLFFTGGSVNPGGGMPMVVLCGQNVCREVVGWDRGGPGGDAP